MNFSKIVVSLVASALVGSSFAAGVMSQDAPYKDNQDQKFKEAGIVKHHNTSKEKLKKGLVLKHYKGKQAPAPLNR